MSLLIFLNILVCYELITIFAHTQSRTMKLKEINSLIKLGKFVIGLSRLGMGVITLKLIKYENYTNY
jgi:hypothetical protein